MHSTKYFSVCLRKGCTTWTSHLVHKINKNFGYVFCFVPVHLQCSQNIIQFTCHKLVLVDKDQTLSEVLRLYCYVATPYYWYWSHTYDKGTKP